MINKIDDGSGVLNFEDFQMVGNARWCSEIPVCDKRQLDMKCVPCLLSLSYCISGTFIYGN